METTEPTYDLAQDLTDRYRAIAPGYTVRRLAGLHDIPHNVLAEFVGSTKQTVGPILTGKRPLGRDLAERFSGAFRVPASVLTDGNYRLALAYGLLSLSAAPLGSFKPQGPDAPANYRKARVEAAKAAGEDARRYYADNPAATKWALDIAEAISGG